MTLLTIVQNAAARLGLSSPASVVASNDETAERLYALANQAGVEIARRHNWTILTKEKTFTTIAAETQTDTPIPTDFDRFVNGTWFNRTAKRYLVGPLSEEEWQVQKNLSVSTLTDSFRIRGGSFLMIPAPAAGQTIAYEYVSKYWVDTDSDGDGDAAAFSSDSHTALLDEEMITADTCWRYQQSSGQSYAETHRTAQIMIADRIARDGGRRVKDYGHRRLTGARRPMIPEGSWNQ